MATDNLAATVEDSFGFRESGLWVSNHQEDGRIRKTVGRYHARILQKMNWHSISHHAKLHRDAWGVCSKVHIRCYSQNGKIEGLHLKNAISLNKVSMAICKSYAISAFLKQRSAASIRRTAKSELQHSAKTKLSRTQVEAPQLLLGKYLIQMAGDSTETNHNPSPTTARTELPSTTARDQSIFLRRARQDPLPNSCVLPVTQASPASRLYRSHTPVLEEAFPKPCRCAARIECPPSWTVPCCRRLRSDSATPRWERRLLPGPLPGASQN